MHTHTCKNIPPQWPSAVPFSWRGMKLHFHARLPRRLLKMPIVDWKWIWVKAGGGVSTPGERGKRDMAMWD